jgi:hypothetical protein
MPRRFAMIFFDGKIFRVGRCEIKNLVPFLSFFTVLYSYISIYKFVYQLDSDDCEK